jgi:hypothetical protein
MLQYLAVGSSPAIGAISTIHCALYCILGAKYSAHPPVYVMWPVDPDICNVITVTYIQASTLKWTYLRSYWRHLDNSMSVILQTWCQIQRTSSNLRYVNCGPGHIQCIYSSIYSDFNIHLNVSALLLYISRQFNARYTAFLVPNTAHILQFTLCELWSRSYTLHLQLRIFRLQYSTVGISDAIADIPTLRCALYCKFCVKYSAHPPVYAMWTVVPDIYKVYTGPHSQATIFNWKYLRYYWRYLDNSMRVILKTWWQKQRTSSGFRYVNCAPVHIQSIYSCAYLGFNIQL